MVAESAERSHTNGAQRRDAAAVALLALETALAPPHEGLEPAAQLEGIREGLRAVIEAEAPRKKARARKDAAAALEGARAAVKERGVAALEEVTKAAQLFRRAHDLAKPPSKRTRWGLGALLKPIPLPKTICRKLEWDVGRPPMIVGPPGSAKTYFAQQIELDLMLGRSLLGSVDLKPPRPCRVLHVDLDQGRAKTLRRLQWLMAGAGCDPTQSPDEEHLRRRLNVLGGEPLTGIGRVDVDEGKGLALMSLEPEEIVRWTAAWLDAARGYDAIFVDSLRRLAPFLDENDSRFSMVPDMLRGVSEERDVVIVLLHHASNKSRGPGKQPDAPRGSRGTSAIDGAAGTQLELAKDKDAYRVVQTRAGEAEALEGFAFVFMNEAAVEGKIRGVRLEYRTLEQVKAPEKEANAEKLRPVARMILEHVKKINVTKGYGIAGRRAIVLGLDFPVRDGTAYAAIQQLVDDKLLLETEQKEGRKNIPRIWAADARRKDEA